MRQQLTKIADDLAHGRQVPPVTTREFLSWFHARRRGYWIVRAIREELQEAHLQTVPDFESAYIDAPIELRQVVAPARQKGSRANTPSLPENEADESTPSIATPITALVSKDPTYRISKLEAANQPVISVKPEASLAECITILMSRDFSQLPVMTSDRGVKGMISWKSIGSRLALSNSATHARDFMDLIMKFVQAHQFSRRSQ